MIGKIYITSSGYDPQLGKAVKDPHLGPCPTLGACRPDIRKQLDRGDHIFVISGKVPNANQFVMAGFQIEDKIGVGEAYRLFPELRLRKLEDGQIDGNIVVDGKGRQHSLDHHNLGNPGSFAKRVENYVVGANLLSLATPDEIAEGRKQTLDALRDVIRKKGNAPIDIVGRWGARLTEEQVCQLREWLAAIKRSVN